MASKKMVAKIKFDDGSKKTPYKPGEEYKGKDFADLEKAGLICTEDQFEISQKKAREALKDREDLLKENDDLRKEIQALKSKPSLNKKVK